MTYNDTVKPLTYMLYDIKALQDLYGANMTYRTGNDTYTAPASGAAYTIWDAGGTDTISAGSVSASVTIDLRAAASAPSARRTTLSSLMA